MLAARRGPWSPGADAEPAEQVAQVLASAMGRPARAVHVGHGRRPRGPEREAVSNRVLRGESVDLPGRPELVLRDLAASEQVSLLVLGAPSEAPPGVGRRRERARGTALAVARRLQKPVVVVPPGLSSWSVPLEVTVVLDGRAATAMHIADELGRLGLGGLPTGVLHVDSPAAVPGRLVGALGETSQGLVPPGDGPARDSARLVVALWAPQGPARRARSVLEAVSGGAAPVLLVPESLS